MRMSCDFMQITQPRIFLGFLTYAHARAILPKLEKSYVDAWVRLGAAIQPVNRAEPSRRVPIAIGIPRIPVSFHWVSPWKSPISWLELSRRSGQ